MEVGLGFQPQNPQASAWSHAVQAFLRFRKYSYLLSEKVEGQQAQLHDWIFKVLG